MAGRILTNHGTIVTTGTNPFRAAWDVHPNYPAVRPSGSEGTHFSSLGSFLHSVRRAEVTQRPDPRLAPMAAGLDSGHGTTGGYLIEGDQAYGLLMGAYEEAVIAPLCDRRSAPRPFRDVKIPAISQRSRADGSRWGGALAHWLAEGSPIPESAPDFTLVKLSPKRLVVAISGTDELMSDVAGLEEHVTRVFEAEMGFAIDAAIIAGSAGTPLGILNSPALITVLKETGQEDGTIEAENIRTMWRHLPAPSRRRAVWLVNEDVDDQLDRLAAVISDENDARLYQPAGTGGSPYPLLKGRPVIAVEQCPALGNTGDIILADLSQYLLMDGGVNVAISVHFRFIQGQPVWRFILRVDGMPTWQTPVAPYEGATARSPFVTLAAR